MGKTVNRFMLFKIENFKDIHVIKMSKTFLGNPVFMVHAFYLDGLLIDTGFVSAKIKMRRFMEEYRVNKVIITHHHEDHVGANAEANKLGIIPLVPEEGIELVMHPHKLQLYRRLTWGMPEPSKALALSSTVQTDNFTFQVIHAPGHSHDHKVFYLQKRGWLFTGDVFLSEHLKYMRDDEDANIMIETLRNLLKLDFDTMFDALRGPIKNGKNAMRNKLEFLEEKKYLVTSLHKKGMDLRSITKQAFGNEGLMTVISGGHYSKINFTKSILGFTKYPVST
ncbi:MAG: MBL fold metallo-hydrolase [bacterium]